MPGTTTTAHHRARRLVPGLVLAVLAVGCGGGGGAEPTAAPSTRPTGSPAAATYGPPATAEEFWARLRASGAALRTPPSPGTVAGERAWGEACRDFGALAAAVKAERDTYRVETGARLTVMQIAAQCVRADASSRRAVSVKIPELLADDPFATP